MAEKKNVTIGIDLGTTYSAVAYVDEHGDARIIPNAQSERITPSVVLFKETENEVVVGQPAKDEIELHPEQVIDFVKREMGKKKEEVRAFDNDGTPKPYKFWGRDLSPEEVSMFILKRLKQDAENALGFPITNAVITVPAYFNDAEREATKIAGTMAGLNVKHILNEPTAAALSFGVMKADKPQTVFVFDLGGGTFDVTVLKIELGRDKVIRMVQTNGDHRLGGKDWDDCIIKYVAKQFQFEHGLNPLEDVEAKADLRIRAENAKKALSSKNITTIICNAHGKKSKIELTKEKFEELTSNLMGRCNALCDLVLKEAELNWSGIDTILLAGGSTRMPMVQEMLKRISGKALQTDLVNPDECVALGAAIQGSILAIENSPKREQPSQEVIAKLGSIKAKDVTSHRLGTAAYDFDDKFKVFTIIPKGEPVPCSYTERFGTRFDNQRSVRFEIKEGESDDPELIPTIQEANLPIINPLPKGAPLEVTYKLSADGMLLVIARDVTNDQKIEVEVERKGILNPEEVKNGMALANRIKVTG